MKKVISLILSVMILVSSTQMSAFAEVLTDLVSSVSESISVGASEASGSQSISVDDSNSGDIEDLVVYEDEEEEEASGLVQQTISDYFEGHQVTVSGMMPEGVSLSLTAVDSDSVDTIVENMDDKGKAVFACDIKVIDSEGNQWQPDNDQVQVSVTNMDVEKGSKLQFYHLVSDIDEIIEKELEWDRVATIEEVSLTTEGEASFETYGFSTYIGFTVTAKKGDYTYTLNGMEPVLLSKILTDLQIAKPWSIQSVTSSDTDELKAYQKTVSGTPSWYVEAVKKLTSTVTLTITSNNNALGKFTIKFSPSDVTYYDFGVSGYDDKIVAENVSVTVKKGEDCYVRIRGNVALRGASTGFHVESGGSLKIYLANSNGATDGNNTTLYRGNLSADKDLIYVANGGNLTIRNEANGDGAKKLATIDKGTTLNDDYGKYTNQHPANNFLIIDGHQVKTTETNLKDANGNEVKDQNDKSYLLVNVDRDSSDRIQSNESLVHCAKGVTSGYTGTTGGKLLFVGVLFQEAENRNTISETAGVVITGEQKQVLFRNCKFAGLKGKVGAVRFAEAFRCTTPLDDPDDDKTAITGGVSFEGCKFLDLESTDNGGAIGVDGTIAEMQIVDLNTSIDTFDVSNNPVTIEYLSSSGFDYVVDTDGTLKPCTADNYGGAINITENANITNLTIKGEISGEGTNNPSSTNYFMNCMANSGGGAINVEGKVGTFTIDGVIIDGCQASNGSAVRLNGPKAIIDEFNFKNSTVKNCQSTNMDGGSQNHGGTIRTTGDVSCVLNLDKCTISGNKSFGHGGGLYWNAAGKKNEGKKSVANITGCNFNDNDAAEMGGGIYCESEMTISATTIKDNTSGKTGGGICQTVYNNADVVTGKMENSLSLDSGVVVSGNSAKLDGGGIALITRYSDSVINGYKFSFIIPEISENAPEVKENVAGKLGGGIYYGTGMETDINDEEYTDSKKKALVDSYVKSVEVLSGSIYNNRAGRDGGGIYAKGKAAAITVRNGNVYGNTAGCTNETIKYIDTALTEKSEAIVDPDDGMGGGICIRGESTKCYFQNGTIGQISDDGKTHADDGGGLAADGSTIYIDGDEKGLIPNSSSSFNFNRAGSNGGGIYVINKGKVVMYGGTVNNNFAKTGGGIYVSEGSTIQLIDGEINNNTADENGGGVAINVKNTTKTYTVDDSALKIDGGTISNNKAKDGSGGGIYLIVSQALATLQNVKVDISDVAMESNTATNTGGAVSILNQRKANTGTITIPKENVVCNITGGTFRSNKAVNENNDFAGRGGAFSVRNATLNINMTDGVIENNTAGLVGGGVYAFTSAEVNINRGYIQDNEAGSGGGVSAESGADINMTDGYVRFNKATSTANKNTTAYGQNENYVGSGGGILLLDGITDSNDPTTFTLSPKTNTNEKTNVGIYGNTAEFAADDVYAVGNFTELEVPPVDGMNLSGYSNVTIDGWYEDYHEKDSEYRSNKKSLGYAPELANNAKRYKEATGGEKKVVTVIKNGIGEDSDNTNNANNTNKYVCMTLGFTASGTLSVEKNVFDANNRSEKVNGKDNTVYNFTITKDGIAQPDLAYSFTNINGISIIRKTDANGGFSLKGGEKLSFIDGLTGTYIITEGDTPAYVTDTTSEILNMSSSDDADGKVVTVNTSESVKTVTFNNFVRSLEITFNYYDRKLVNGSYADLNSEATKITQTYYGSELLNENGNLCTLSNMIVRAGVNLDKNLHGVDNILDEYYLFTSQSQAVDKMLTMTYIKTGEKYNSNQAQYHTNQYGEPQTGGKWVTYYNGSQEIDETNVVTDVTGVNLWLFNTPKKYSVKVHSIDEDGNLSFITNGGRYVANTTGVETTAYYNQRLGNSASDVDAVNNYFVGYGNIQSYNGFEAVSKREVTYNGTDLVFSYWALDPQGEIIASTDYSYQYRITKNIELYAVYETAGDASAREKGLSVIGNSVDTYVDSNNVAKTRLNTVLNPYGYKVNDPSIDQVAMVYVIAKGTTNTDGTVSYVPITSEVLSQLRNKIVSALQNKPDKTSFAVSVGIDGFSNANFDVVVAKGTLTNKNRAQFVKTFSTSALANRRILAFGALNDGSWKTSDNYVDYTFNADSKIANQSVVTQAPVESVGN